MRRKSILFILILSLAAFPVLSGCDSTEEGTEDAAEGSEEEAPKNEYEEYIRSALDSVNGGKPAASEPSQTPDPGTAEDTAPVPADTGDDDDFYYSSMENPDEYEDPFASSEDEEPSPTEEADGTPTPTPTPYITPEEFEVGKCCIYINGETDSAYGTEMISAINKARTDLGYDPLITNKGLTTCADRRTREVAASLSHIRPNGYPFYSLAPEHFRAEMLLKDNLKAEDAVDTLIKRDPVSRGLIFTETYKSIGASSFKCNGQQCTVVSFGF